MKKINKGIVFSNDIYRILKGNNALDYTYEGMIIPSESFIKNIRKDFSNTVNSIFSLVTIIDEDSMLEGLNNIMNYGSLPHYIIR